MLGGSRQIISVKLAGRADVALGGSERVEPRRLSGVPRQPPAALFKEAGQAKLPNGVSVESGSPV